MLYSNLEFNLKDIVYRIHISISSSIICSRRKTSLRSAYPIYVKLYSQNIPQNNLKWLITQILLSNISKRKLHQNNLQIEEFLYGGGGGTYPNIKILIRGGVVTS